MALKIEHIDNNSVHGILDGALEFRIAQEGGKVIATIASWTRELAGRSSRSVNEMRLLTYELLAHYREDQRKTACV